MTPPRTTAVAGDDQLAQFLEQAWRFPLLGREEEQTLVSRWRERSDIDAAHRLVASHIRLVVKIAMSYRNYGLPVADLISEGNVGLMRAVGKFDPDRGVRFSTCAQWWIKAAILDHVLQSWSLVRLGSAASQKKLFFKLRGLKARMGIFDGGELSREQAQYVSDMTDISADEVIRFDRRLSGRDLSLNAPAPHDHGADGGEIMDGLADDQLSVEEQLADRDEMRLRSRLLDDAMAALPAREQHIFRARYLSEERPTLQQLGRCHGVSHERVRQIEKQALQRVKSYVSEGYRESAGASP